MAKKNSVGVAITPDGTRTTVVSKGKTFSLDEVQAHVGGYVEMVSIPGNSANVLLVDEEGLLKGLAPNRLASLLACRPIVGPALALPRTAFV